MNYPETYKVEEFCDVFLRMIEELELSGAHLVGSSLGGFLAQKLYGISESTKVRVVSLILCNTFIDTLSFDSRYSARL